MFSTGISSMAWGIFVPDMSGEKKKGYRRFLQYPVPSHEGSDLAGFHQILSPGIWE
jgi:hypothetical protein